MSQEDHKPRRLDKVWDQRRQGTGQPNGYITNIDWSEQEVTVRFYDGEYDTYSFDELADTYSHAFGGCYMIHLEIPADKIKRG